MKKQSEDMSQWHEDAFRDYVTYYEALWPLGNVKLCSESSVADRAKCLLLSESKPEKRFSAFDLYWIVYECLKKNKRDCRVVLCGLAKATELLEMYCVNVFLFPWKKEIKTLKTFTGTFVYHVTAVLPDHVANNILESIGYHQDTDMEYRLSKDVNPDRSIRVGFELFLARQECKYLLEVMGQRSPSECLQVLQERSLARYSLEGMSEYMADGSGDDMSLKAEVTEAVSLAAATLLDPGVAPNEGCQPAPESAALSQDSEQRPRSLEALPSNCTPTPVVRHQPCNFMSDDKSILELQKNYPDLTFRQKPVFSKAQVRPADQCRPGGETRQSESGPKGLAAASSVSGPQSTPGISEPCCAPEGPIQTTLQLGEAVPKQLPDESGQGRDAKLQDTQHSTRQSQQAALGDRQGDADDSVMVELTEKLGNLQVKERSADKDLKYPIEETSHPDGRSRVPDKIMPISAPRDRTQAIACSPSPIPICNIPDCTSCAKPNTLSNSSSGPDTIKEPPYSFYIPPSPMATQHPMLDGRAELCRDVPASYPQCLQTNPGSCSRSEDELLQTYVLVESEKKDEKLGGGLIKAPP